MSVAVFFFVQVLGNPGIQAEGVGIVWAWRDIFAGRNDGKSKSVPNGAEWR
jgi:hypothetical protein